MRARYNGVCKDCDGDIQAGDEIRWSKKLGARHADCDDHDHDDYRMACGCTDYHMADCDLVTSRYG